VSVLDELRLVAISDLERIEPHTLVARWEALAHAARPGSVAIDLRAPGRPARALFELGEALKQVALRHAQLFVVNERIDLALLLAADALHLREDSVDTAAARRLVGNLPVIRACHSAFDVPSLDADAALLSPVLEARKGNAPLGLAALRAAKDALSAAGKRTRLIALGGVDAARASGCIDAGADAVAAIGSALGDVSALRLLRALELERNPQSG